MSDMKRKQRESKTTERPTPRYLPQILARYSQELKFASMRDADVPMGEFIRRASHRTGSTREVMELAKKDV